MKVQDKTGNWIFIAPIEGISLTNETSFEFTIDRVTLVSEARLRRVRKRLGFTESFSEISKRIGKENPVNELLSESEVFAVYRCKGKGSDLESEMKREVTRELDYFSASQLIYTKRGRNASPRLSQGRNINSLAYCMYLRSKPDIAIHKSLTGRYNAIKIDKYWTDYQSDSFFLEFLSILQRKKNITAAWRKDILNSTLLAGRSQSTEIRVTAFLWNMIAIETLLTGSNDKYSIELPKRVYAFLGWLNDWAENNFQQRISKLYKKRCDIVHAGNVDVVEPEDLIFSDVLLYNTLNNILNHLDIFSSKDKVIEFSEKVQAEKLLDINVNTRPDTLSYTTLKYTAKDRAAI